MNAQTADKSTASNSNLMLVFFKARTFIALIAVFVYFSFTADNFLSTANMVIMAKHVVPVAFVGIGMTFVIVSGGIDLSVGSIVGLCGMVAGYLVINGIDVGLGWSIQFNTLEICMLVMLVGMAVGALNGFLITKLHVAPFIATLGTLYVANGAALLSSNGETFPNLTGSVEYGSASFPKIGTGEFLYIPFSIWMLIVVAVLATYIASRTPLGRHIYAVGGNERAAGLSGINVHRTKFFVYIFSGLCAALVGIVLTSQLVAAHPLTGQTFELNAIAAAVLGGTSMSGGRGKIGGTIIGAFVIVVLSDGMVMMGIVDFWQTVIKGLVIIAAVVVDQAQQKVQSRVALQAQAAVGK